uniref:Sec1 family domain containing 2 n=1 Tax=Crocodylus porosus TaxID=8502 RepID=A0A7M4ESM6_CROPO
MRSAPATPPPRGELRRCWNSWNCYLRHASTQPIGVGRVFSASYARASQPALQHVCTVVAVRGRLWGFLGACGCAPRAWRVMSGGGSGMAAAALSFCRQAWEPVLAKARRAVVFLDAACAESLHWGGGGAARLLAAGALRVKELSSFEAGGPGQPKALFVDLFRLNSSRPEKRKLSSLSDLDFASLPTELQLQIRMLVSGLNALFEFLDVREESFAIGTLSKFIAGDLANYALAKNRRKTAQGRASVIFIDRTLDLTGAVGHHGDNLAEKVLSMLPKLPGHANDVMVNMVELTALQTPDDSCSIIAPGCLAQPNDPAAKALWESFMNLKHKEAVMEVRRHLVEAASRENLPIKMSMGRVTPEQLSSYIQLFKNNFKALENHCGLLQLVLATIQTLKHPKNAKWDNFLAFERLLLQNIGESEMPSVLNQLLPMIKSHNKRKEDDYNCEDFLILLVYIYSVVGEIRAGKVLDEAEGEVKKALVQAFCDEPELSSLLQKITGCDSAQTLTFEKAMAAVDSIFKSLWEVSRARMNMKQFNSVHIPGSNIHQATYKPLLKQVVEEIFNYDRPDPVDIEHMSAGLTDLLKTGFSMFMKVNRPHPGDHPLLIFYMVGGVTVSEVKMLKDLISARKPSVQVIVLSSTLLTPLHIPELLFATDHLQPDIGI